MRRHSRVLVVNESAGSMKAKEIEKIRSALPGFEYVEYSRKLKLTDLLSARAKVVVAGGDGSVERIARQLLNTHHALGIIAGGTYNNLASGLGIPADIDGSLDVVRTGSPRPVPIGRINGEPFFEGAIVGRLGEVLLAGEAAKDVDLGALLERLRRVVSHPEFEFTLSGDLEAGGKSRTLVFANTPRMGARLRVAEGSPRDAWLELSFGGASFRFSRLRLRTRPRVRCFADARAAGRTPALIELDKAALRVLLKS